MHEQRGSEIEFNLNSRAQPRDLANYRYRTPEGGGEILLSLIKLATDWGGTISHSDGLVFTTFWPTAIFLPSSFPFHRVCAVSLPSHSTPLPHILIWRRDSVKMAVLCWAQGSWVQPFHPFCIQNDSFIPTHINYALFELYHQSVIPNVISSIR